MGKIQQFIKKKIGNTTHTFVVEGENLHEVIMTAQKLSFYDVFSSQSNESQTNYSDIYLHPICLVRRM